MAYLGSRFTGSLVFVYDKDDNIITKTTITGYDRDEMYIEIVEGMEDIKPGTRLKLLIIHSSGASEMKGTLKSIRQGIYEITIYGEYKRGTRSTVRFPLWNSAVISDMATDSGRERLSEPVPVTIENLSSGGVLIRTQGDRFEIGTLLQIEFRAHGKEGLLYGEVVREQACNHGVYKYGCKLFFMDDYQTTTR